MSTRIPSSGRLTLVGLFIAILTTELWLLGHSTEPIYASGGRLTVFSLAFLAWWALTLTLLAQRCFLFACRLGHRVASGRMSVNLIMLAVMTTALIVAYAISWGLYVQSGRFANWEVIRFSVINASGLWYYVSEAEPVHLVRLVAVVVLACVALPILVRQVGSRLPTESSRPIYQQRIWIWSTVVLCLAASFLVRDPSPRRRFARLGQVKCSLNPAVSFAVSVVEAINRDPISPRMDFELLRPVSSEWSVPAEDTHKRPIIVVAIESLRSDVVHATHQGREITPNINRLARNGINWTRAYSQSTHSDYADICIVSSLYPLRSRTHHYYSKNDPWPKTLIYDLLKPLGYETAIISSQNEAWGCMDRFLESPQLDLFYHPQTAPNRALELRAERDVGFYIELEAGALQAGKFPDRHTADVAIEWIRKQTKSGKPFFLSMNLQSSHFPFLMPDDVERPFQPCELDSEVRFMIFPESKTDVVKNAYFNALHEADRQVGRLADALQEEGILDDAILLVIGENGEAFHENGSCGHGREPVEPAIHVATVIHAPDLVHPTTEDYPLEHVDLMPTVLGLLNWAPHPNFQGIDVLSPNRPPLSERLLFFHVLSPSARADAIQWAGRWKYQINHASQESALYDLEQDPAEAHNLVDQEPEIVERLHRLLNEWRQRQLAYYHFPDYYLNFFPPPSPTMTERTKHVVTQRKKNVLSDS